MKGVYIIILNLNKGENIQIGKLAKIQFNKGFYMYVGSALGPGGFKRVERYYNINEGKKYTRKWHIDYLLPYTEIYCTVLIPTNNRIECELASELKNFTDIQEIEGFGCSDCNCDSHLFYSENEMKNDIINVCKKFGDIITKNFSKKI